MKKILFLTGEISTYNVSVYNEINKQFDVTVGYYDKDKSKSSCDFIKMKLNSHKVGSLVFIRGIRNLSKDYSVIVLVPDLHVPSYCVIPFFSHENKVGPFQDQIRSIRPLVLCEASGLFLSSAGGQ